MKYKKKPITDILRSWKTVFTFKDIALIWRNTSKKGTISGVNYYVKTGELIRLRRGIYAKDKNYNRLELATRILTPSYVSFETVLTQAGINFQFYAKMTAASYQTREIVVDGQTYSYKKIKGVVLTFAGGIEHKNECSVASPERAFLDTIYIHKNYHFDNLNPLNWDKVFEFLPAYDNKRMARQVNELFKQTRAA